MHETVWPTHSSSRRVANGQRFGRSAAGGVTDDVARVDAQPAAVEGRLREQLRHLCHGRQAPRTAREGDAGEMGGEIRGDLGASASATFGKMMFCSTVARISPAEYASA